MQAVKICKRKHIWMVIYFELTRQGYEPKTELCVKLFVFYGRQRAVGIVLKPSGQQDSVKRCRADSRIRCFRSPDVWETDSVSVMNAPKRLFMWNTWSGFQPENILLRTVPHVRNGINGMQRISFVPSVISVCVLADPVVKNALGLVLNKRRITWQVDSVVCFKSVSKFA